MIITNGLDVQTREAVAYWKERGLEIRPWIYRIYQTENKERFLEFNTFRTKDDPFEDIEEGYFIVNTDYSNDKRNDADMLKNAKVAAYFDPWKRHITRIKQNDKVFLYRSGTGIVAMGTAKSEYKKKNYHDSTDIKNKDQEFYVELKNFVLCSKPMSASEIVNLTGVNYRFMGTCFSVDKESGTKIWTEILRRQKVA